MDPNGATLPRFAPGHSGVRGRSGARAGGAGPWVIGAVGFVLLAAALVARCVRRVVVSGDSMSPTLLDGDRLVVLARPWGIAVRAAVGDVVAVPDPRRPDRVLVKRVTSVNRPDGTIEVHGDSPDASTDSRQFGAVPLASVVGRVVHRYGPPGRSGPVGRPTEYDRA